MDQQTISTLRETLVQNSEAEAGGEIVTLKKGQPSIPADDKPAEVQAEIDRLSAGYYRRGCDKAGELAQRRACFDEIVSGFGHHETTQRNLDQAVMVKFKEILAEVSKSDENPGEISEGERGEVLKRLWGYEAACRRAAFTRKNYEENGHPELYEKDMKDLEAWLKDHPGRPEMSCNYKGILEARNHAEREFNFLLFLRKVGIGQEGDDHPGFQNYLRKYSPQEFTKLHQIFQRYDPEDWSNYPWLPPEKRGTCQPPAPPPATDEATWLDKAWLRYLQCVAFEGKSVELHSDGLAYCIGWEVGEATWPEACRVISSAD